MDNLLNTESTQDQFAVLEIDGIVLAFLKDEILSIEDLSKLSDQKYTEQVSASIKYAGADLPAYTLNKDFLFKQRQDSENRICVVIKHPVMTESFALLCKSVKKFTIDDLTNLVPLPSLMKQKDTPLTAMTKQGDTLLFMSSASAMKSFISYHEMSPRLERENV